MLGRLRMDVNDCIEQYLTFSNTIFQPHRIRHLQYYSRRKVQDAVKEVVKKFCYCHEGEETCDGREDLRQYDYDEVSSGSKFANKTCKVAVLTVREVGTTTFERNRADMNVLFRSYNHRVRNPPDATNLSKELNPRTLENAQLQIHEACMATSAAPTYFKPFMIRNRRYVDGSIEANNPSPIAWNEATQMIRPPLDQTNGRTSTGHHVATSNQIPATSSSPTTLPHALVSIGTGMSKRYDRFGRKSIIFYAFKKVTDTTEAHENAKGLSGQSKGSYFRFEVPSDHELPGLAGISLAACDKSHKASWRTRTIDRLSSILGEPSPRPNTNADPNTNDSLPSPSATARLQHRGTLVKEREMEDRALYKKAEEQRKGGFKPSKYNYKTFDDIREQTLGYCSGKGKERIAECAKMLRDHMVKRRDLENEGNSEPSFAYFRGPDFWKEPGGHVSTGGSSQTRVMREGN
ncbi:putative lysophospholipase-like protein [Rosellinia necatrix]|uniref:Putative lysophospholipase-like protein n=1 Tax=Rosellinia necatrix TaxID=77044 RepID=A0A1W2TD05_ROSNE|nr:putative lysophospholipase-like protein [Rosellinia necatrix]